MTRAVAFQPSENRTVEFQLSDDPNRRVSTNSDVSRAVAVVPLTALAVAGATLFPSEFKVLETAVTDKVQGYLPYKKTHLPKTLP